MQRSHATVAAIAATSLVPVMLALPASAAATRPAPVASFASAGAAVRDVTSVGATGAQTSTLRSAGIHVVQAPDGAVAVVDRSLAARGITSATTPSSVDLAWKAFSPSTRYVVTRNGVVVSTTAPGTSTYRDASVVSGRRYTYTVSPVAAAANAKAPSWGVKTKVPAGPAKGAAAVASMRRQAVVITAAAIGSTTTVSWITFIPQAKIDAPPVGCDYGSGYQFEGDNRTTFDWRASTYRTALHALITWSTKTVTENTAIHPTKVYRKTTGALVATRTASAADMVARKLGSGSTYVDIRMVTHASNPFCSVGAIDGAFSMSLTTSGSWSFISGNHRQMPNHHVYIYDQGVATTVYTRTYASALCLIGSATCALANFNTGPGRF